MTCKKTACYSHVFHCIHNNVLNLDCVAVITDFERAMRTALREVIGDKPEYIGCWFHFTQAVRKHAMQAGLSITFAQNKELKHLYYRLLCLPLLPVNEIVGVFGLLKKEFLAHNNAVVEQFVVGYFEKQWILRVGILFFCFFDLDLIYFVHLFVHQEGPKSICVHKQPTRTTSSVEAYNGFLGKDIPGGASFFRFVEALQVEELTKSRDFCQDIASGGDITQKKKRKDVVSFPMF